MLRFYELDATERQMLELACEALAMARDQTAKTAERLMAAGRFQALVRQLDLESAHGEVEEVENAGGAVAAFPRRVK